MNTKVVVLLVGTAGLFWAWRQHQKTNTSLGIPAPVGKAAAPPAASGARVDNQSQPWYVGSKAALSSTVQGYAQDPTKALKDGQTIIQSTASIWGTVSGFFSSDSGSQGSADDMPEITDPSTLPASDVSQSNILGAQIGYFDASVNEPIMNYNSDDSVDWTLDYSDPNGIGADNGDMFA